MRKGFSLVELSVVIVIIGLLVGVLVAARSLRNAAQIQATITDLGKYKQAAIQYKEKYYYWPGDDPGMSAVWSEIASSENGDGNGQIQGCFAINCEAIYPEMFIAPQALVLAGFITGNYSATQLSYTPGITFPASPINKAKSAILSKAIYIYLYDNTISGSAAINKNVISINDVDGTVNFGFNQRNGFVVASDAYAIDQKIDDGVAGTGYVRSLNGVANTCLNIGTGTYDINNTNAACIIDFLME